MEYRIFNQKKGFLVIGFISLLLALGNPGFASNDFKRNANSFADHNLKPGKNWVLSGFDDEAARMLSVLGRSLYSDMIMSAPPPIPIMAYPDSGYVNGYNGNASLVNIFTNDSFNNLPVIGSAMKVTITPSNSHISVDTLTGVVSVTAGIAAGDYVIPYSICDTSNLSNCSVSVLTIHVTAPLISTNADGGSVNGYDGSANLLNVYANDSINGIPVTAGAVTTSIVIPASNPGVALNILTGVISVAPIIPAGLYTIVYRNCDTLNPTNCDTALVNINVTVPLIIANADDGIVNGYNGSANLLNVFSNDSINGIPVTAGAVTTSIVIPASNPGVALNILTGVISVAPIIPAGLYTIVYRNCDTLNPTNCDTALVTITVTVPPIVANADLGSVNGYNGQSNLIYVLGNDSLNNLGTSPGPVILSVVTPASLAAVSLNISTGYVSVAPNTIAGNYTIIYSICDSVNTGNCDTAIVLITVLPPPIFANADYVAVNGYNGSLNVLNIYANDLINSIGVTSGRVSLSILSSPSEPGIILNSGTGKISVFPMTPAGIYTYIYRICDTLNTSNCDTAMVTVDVLPPIINANADFGTVNGYNGNANLLNVFSNDSLNNKGTDISSVYLSLIMAAIHPGVVLNLTNGVVSVAVGTPAGLYTIDYRICDTLNPTNCDSAIVSVNVTAPLIKATVDNGSVNGYNGNASLLNVLANDSINGGGIVAGSVNLSLLIAAGNAGITLNLVTGVVSVTGIIPAGIYTLQYKICDTLNPGNCDSAVVTVTVLAPPIVANANYGSVNGADGNANLLNVFTNDSINGFPVSLGSVLTTVVTPASLAGISLDTATGIVSVTAHLPTGLYTIVYRICDTLNTSSCDTSIVFVTITPPAIVANDDSATVNGFTGSANLLNVLVNDSLGSSSVLVGTVYISVTLPASNPGISLNTATGVVSVAPRITAGTYSIHYKICDTLNTLSCDTAVINIQVLIPPIIAVNDTGFVNGYNGTLNLLNVLSNDSISSVTIPLGAALIKVLTPASHSGIVLDTLTGIVRVSPMILSGSFSIYYSITDTLNLSNGDSAFVLINVMPPPLIATADFASVNGYNGADSLLKVMANDSLNNLPVIVGAVKLIVITPASHPGIILNDTTGIVKVTPRVPAGIYTIIYRISDTFNLGNIDTTTVTITVLAPPIIATNDSAIVNGYNGNSNLLNVLANDSLNGSVLVAGLAKLSVITPASHSGIILNDTTGVVSFTARVPAGIYFIVYRISDTLNISNDDTGLVVINVNAPLIVAINDTALVNGHTGTGSTINALSNDSINGVQATAGNIKLMVSIPSGSPNILLDTNTGYLNVTPATPIGNYTITYIIFDTLNTLNSDTATLYIQIVTPSMYANADSVSVNGYDGNLNLLNVLANDSFSSSTVTVGRVYFSVISTASNPGVVLNIANGRLSVFPGTYAGLFHIIYRICDTLDPSICDTALVTINVESPQIIATNDSAIVNGYNGPGYLLDIFSNDSINQTLASVTSVSLKVLVPFGNPDLLFDTLSGIVDMGSPVMSGSYFMQYQIGDTLNPGNLDTAIVYIEVQAPSIIATNDTGSVNGYLGTANLLNVLFNDSLNSTPNPGMVKINLLAPSGNAGVLLDTLTGIVSVAPSTFAGTYFIQYSISDTVNIGNDDTAWVVIYVGSGTLVATADTGTINGFMGMANLLNVLDNDSLNGSIANISVVKLQLLIPSGNAGVTLDTLTGFISVVPLTDAGTYSICYTISDTLNLTNIDTAYATIFVFASGPVANPDFAITPSGTVVTINPLINDFDIDANINIGSILITVPPIHGIAVADVLTGIVTYTPDALWSGFDTLTYSICDTGMVPVLCDTSFIVIQTMDSLSVNSQLVTDNKCYGDSTGSIILTMQGGFPPYNISWNTVPVQTGNMITNLKAGIYQATVTDSMNKSTLVNITVNQPLSPISIVAINTEPKCYGEFNGGINLNVSGGTAPYTYYWSNGNILKNLDKINAGTYNVTITDTNGCVLQTSVILGEPNPLMISMKSIKDVICKSSPEGMILLNVFGGIKPYSYLWSTGDTSLDLNNIPDGQYKITVTDSNACSIFENYTVSYSKENCDHHVFLPHGFSPNDDGINDGFYIDGIDKYPDNYLRIYNRWGGLVFEQHGYKNTWKGTAEAGIILFNSGDNQLPTGTYFYVLDLAPGLETISGYFYISK